MWMTGRTPPEVSIVARLRVAGCVFAEDEAALLMAAATSPADLEAMVDLRVSGRPLEYIVGWAEFCGLRIAVDDGVFVPRQRTAFLVSEAAALVRAQLGRTIVVVDLCCGSGAIGVAVLSALDRVELHAADVDPIAVRCARRNVEPVGGHVYQGDLYEPLPVDLRGRVDLLVVNAPYVPTEAIELMPPEARDYEARVALDGGGDGLDVHRRVAVAATAWLAPGGHLLIETSERQAPVAADIFTSSGLVARVASDDELDATVVIGTASSGRWSTRPGAFGADPRDDDENDPADSSQAGNLAKDDEPDHERDGGFQAHQRAEGGRRQPAQGE